MRSIGCEEGPVKSARSAALALLLLVGFLSTTATAHEAPADEKYVDALKALKLHLSQASENITVDSDAAFSHLLSAWDIYNATLAADGSPLAPQSHMRIQKAFEGALTAIAAGDITLFSIQSQFIKKGALDLAWRATWYYLTSEVDVHLAHSWYVILEDKFGWTQEDPARQAMTAILQDHAKVEEERGAFKEAAMSVFAGKVREEVFEAEALLNTDQATARVKAAEALAYYYPLAEDIAGKVGEEKRITIEAWLHMLQVYARDGYMQGLQVARSHITSVLDEYQGLKGIPEIRRMIDALSFTLEEYGEGVSPEGVVINQEELEEAKTFLALAQDLWAQVKVRLEAVDPQRVADVDAGLQLVANLIDDLASPDEVKTAIKELITILEGLAGEGAGGALSAFDHLALLREALSEALEAYKQGKGEEADRMVATAYLEHFEPIEAELARGDPEMMRDLEVDIRVELRELIQQGADVDVVEAKVTDINQRLLQAEDVLRYPVVVRELDTNLLGVLMAVIVGELVAILFLLANLRVLKEKLREESA